MPRQKPRNPIVQWGHPLARNLCFALVFNEGGGNRLQDLVSGHTGTLSGTSAWGNANIPSPEPVGGSADNSTYWEWPNRAAFDNDNLAAAFSGQYTSKDAYGAICLIGDAGANHWAIQANNTGTDTVNYFNSTAFGLATGIDLASHVSGWQNVCHATLSRPLELRLQSTVGATVVRNNTETYRTNVPGKPLRLFSDRGGTANVTMRMRYFYLFSGEFALDSQFELNADPYCILTENTFRRYFVGATGGVSRNPVAMGFGLR